MLVLTQLHWNQRERRCRGWGHTHPVFHHRILKSLEIFELFIRRAFSHHSFCLCLLCCVVMFVAVYYPQSDWYRVYILSPEHGRREPTHNHLLISAQIPAPPAACMLNTFDISPALNAAIQTRTDVSHPPVFSMQMLSFVNAQMANKIKDELKRRETRRNDLTMCE